MFIKEWIGVVVFIVLFVIFDYWKFTRDRGDNDNNKQSK